MKSETTCAALETVLCGVRLKNPVIAASGTFGFGREYAEVFDIGMLGGIASKGLTLHQRPGNEGIRIWETPSGLMNSIGLENPGVSAFLERELPFMRACGAAVIANLGGHCLDDYTHGAALLDRAEVDILEVNISCPNVKTGGMAFGMTPASAAEVTAAVRCVTRRPIMMKLTPNAENVADVARACEAEGADAVSLVNTFLGMAIDVAAKRAVFDNGYAGLSGPAIRPIALRMVHQTARAVRIPVCGMGGIATADVALQFLMAGAAAVQVGSATFADRQCIPKLIDDLAVYCRDNKLKNISDIRGIV